MRHLEFALALGSVLGGLVILVLIGMDKADRWGRS